MSVIAISSTHKDEVEQACLNRAQAEPEPLDNEPDGDLAYQNCPWACFEVYYHKIFNSGLEPDSSFFLE